jgi:hypothetical protein
VTRSAAIDVSEKTPTEMRQVILDEAIVQIDELGKEAVLPPDIVAFGKQYVSLVERYCTPDMVEAHPGLLYGLGHALNEVGSVLGALAGFHNAQSRSVVH